MELGCQQVTRSVDQPGRRAGGNPGLVSVSSSVAVSFNCLYTSHHFSKNTDLSPGCCVVYATGRDCEAGALCAFGCCTCCAAARMRLDLTGGR